MGAIAGSVYADAQQTMDWVEPMLETMGYRGQHHREIHTWKNVQLGTCEAILGRNEHQPVIAVMDGSILNSDSLKVELEKVGYQFGVDSAMDVLIAAYHHWGVDFLKRIDGDFSLALLDTRSQELLLARDRIGKKPLYWFHDAQAFLFASELKALLITGAVPQTPALDAIASYLSLGYCPQDVTPIAGVNKLLPGYYLLLKLNRYKIIHPYWSYSSYFLNINKNRQDLERQIDERLSEATRKRLSSSESIGCFLSDSLGSASVAHYLSQLRDKQRLTAFTVGFQKGDPQSIEATSEMAQRLGISQVVEVVTPTNALQDLPKIIWHLDEPLADMNILLTWRLARLSAMTSGMVFSGTGYNELCGVHPRYFTSEKPSFFYRFKHTLLKFFARYALIPLLHFLRSPRAFGLLRHLQSDPWQVEFLEANTIFDDRILSEASPKLAELFEVNVLLQKFHHLKRISSRTASFMYLDIKTRLPDQTILEYDRLTAAFGLKWQTPFLDTSLIQYLAGFPKSEGSASDLSGILRKGLPDTVITRQKQKSWVSGWATDSHIIKAFEFLETGILADTDLLSRSWLRRQLMSDASRLKAFQQLWALLVLEVWFRLYIKRPMSQIAPDISLLALLKE